MPDDFASLCDDMAGEILEGLGDPATITIIHKVGPVTYVGLKPSQQTQVAVVDCVKYANQSSFVNGVAADNVAYLVRRSLLPFVPRENDSITDGNLPAAARTLLITRVQHQAAGAMLYITCQTERLAASP